MTDAMRFETAAIHAGQDPDPTTGAVIVPIYQTSTYVQDSVGTHKGFEYSRTDNPTRSALDVCLAALEGAAYSLSFSSGMGAITTLAMSLKQGDLVVIPDDVYGGTFRLFDKVMNNLGLRYTAVDMTDLDAVAEATRDGAQLVIAETPTNPKLKILDLRALAQLAHDSGALFAVDNTFATPYIQRPLELGADLVIYSATKYLGGHSDLVMGTIALNDDAMHARLRFLQNAAGAVPGPFDCWLLLRGLKTLSLRMRAHSAGAEVVANWLTQQDSVANVFFPGLADFPGHDIAKAQMTASGEPLYGGMVSFEAHSEEAALDVCRRTKLFFLGESLGGVESLIEHPGQMTHFSLEGSGFEISPALVRLSIGIEHPDDLVADLAQALA